MSDKSQNTETRRERRKKNNKFKEKIYSIIYFVEVQRSVCHAQTNTNARILLKLHFHIGISMLLYAIELVSFV